LHKPYQVHGKYYFKEGVFDTSHKAFIELTEFARVGRSNTPVFAGAYKKFAACMKQVIDDAQ